MNPKKILLYIEPKSSIESVSRFTMNLARFYEARVFVLSIIQHAQPEIKTRSEERAWKRLYEIEEDAFENGIKISLLLEEIDMLTQQTICQKLTDIIRHFQSDVLILSADVKLNINKLIKLTTIPIIVVPSNENLMKLEV